MERAKGDWTACFFGINDRGKMPYICISAETSKEQRDLDRAVSLPFDTEMKREAQYRHMVMSFSYHTSSLNALN